MVGGYDLAWIQSFESGNPFSFSFVNSPYNYYPTAIGNQIPNLTCSGISMPQFGLGDRIGGNRFNQALEIRFCRSVASRHRLLSLPATPDATS